MLTTFRRSFVWTGDFENEWTDSKQIGTRGQRRETTKFGVKGQGHVKPKLDLDAWRKHHSLPASGFLYRVFGFNRFQPKKLDILWKDVLIFVFFYFRDHFRMTVLHLPVNTGANIFAETKKL